MSSRPNSSFTLDFYSNVQCDPSTNGEGQVWIGSLAVATRFSCPGAPGPLEGLILVMPHPQRVASLLSRLHGR